jgi:soluble lytic murein transglycosylase-like protein/TolA-binding protein
VVRRLWLPLAALIAAACAGPEQAIVPGPSGQAGLPIVVSGGTPVALLPSVQPTATTAVVVSVRTSAQPTPTAPSPIASSEPLAQKIVPPTATSAPTRTPPAEPAERELWTLERAEADMDAGRHREALARLDAGPLPADVGDLAAVRKAELGLTLGDRARARAELSVDTLVKSSNRMLLLRAAEVAERAELWDLAGDYWTRASRQPTWQAEKASALRLAAHAYAKAGDAITAAERASQLADMLGKNPDPELVASLKANDALTAYHAGLLALVEARYAEAGQRFRRYLEVAPGGPYAALARDRLSTLGVGGAPSGPNPWNAARDADTAEAYAAFRAAYPTHWQAPEALFREGLAHQRDAKIADAVETWHAAAAPSSSAENRARALYWIGKTFFDQGDAEAAREKWSLAASIRPSSFYTVRAADRIAGEAGWPSGGAQLPAGRSLPEEDAEALRWLDTWAGKSGPTAAESASIGRAAKFARIGLERTAGAELDTLIESSPNARTVYEAGKRAQEHGLWLSLVRAGSRLGRMSPGKVALDAPRAVRRMAYPTGYADLVGAESARRDLGPLLMLSLIRQESLFDRYARSIADARGLTQVMPSTGAEIARSIGRGSFAAEELYDPSTSVGYGARYLRGQLTGFQGDVFRAVAAYNAGGGAANRWARGIDDPDVYVESIGYAETREYVKSIYIHHAAYRSLVGGL